MNLPKSGVCEGTKKILVVILFLACLGVIQNRDRNPFG